MNQKNGLDRGFTEKLPGHARLPAGLTEDSRKSYQATKHQVYCRKGDYEFDLILLKVVK